MSVLLLIYVILATVLHGAAAERRFGSILVDIVANFSAPDYDTSSYSLSSADFMALSSINSNVEECSPSPSPTPTPSTPSAYLSLSFYSDSCGGTLGFELSFPVGVCVNYGTFSEYLTISQSILGVLSVTVYTYSGSGCKYLFSVAGPYSARNGACCFPFTLAYLQVDGTTTLPSVGAGIVSE